MRILQVFDHAPVSRVFKLFRTMGLKHLSVLGPDSRLAGVVTRSDLTENNIQVYTLSPAQRPSRPAILPTLAHPPTRLTAAGPAHAPLRPRRRP